MLSRFKSSRNSSIILKAIQILPRTDRPKIVAIALLQAGLGFLDLLGVAALGMMGALVATGRHRNILRNTPDFVKQAHLMGF